MKDLVGDQVDIDKMPDELFRQLTDPKSKDYSGMRTHTKALSKERLKKYTEGRLGVIIDGTGHNFEKLRVYYTFLTGIEFSLRYSLTSETVYFS